jgi:hypothetical protein
MNARIRKRIHTITDLCIDAKDFGHDCFYSFQPHVNNIHFDFYKDGWEKDKEAILYEDIKLNSPETIEKLDSVIEALEQLIEESV